GGRCVLARRRLGAALRAGADRDRARLLPRSERKRDSEAPAGSTRFRQELEAARSQPARDATRRGVAVRHEEAWTRLPDLLDDRDDAALLTHVRACADCHGQIFLLWAGDNTRAPMQVGRFMVDRSGGCRVRFNLPATHTWSRFWITRPGSPAAIVAST